MSATPKLTKEENEAMILGSFLEFCPSFGGEPTVEWSQPKPDPPDILAITSSQRKIGVEMCSWLDEQQTACGVSYQRTEESLVNALGDQGTNTLKNVHQVWVHPKESPRIRPEDEAGFRDEVHRKIAELDELIGHDGSWSPQGEVSNDFSRYPVLGKHLDSIRCWPRKTWRPGGFVMKKSYPGTPWIHMRARGGAYSTDVMLEALYAALDKKRSRYSGKPAGMDEFHLLIHYDKALYYNTPIEGLNLKVEDMARKAKDYIGTNAGPFRKIFLYLAVEPGRKVFQLCSGS